MFQSREKTRRFRASVCALVVRTASVGVASCAILSAQTLLNTRNLSGSANDTPTAIATDSQGNVYIAGATTSPDFPLTQALFAQLPEPALRVSTDGRTFVPATLSAPEVDSVAASSDGRLVLAATSAGLYRSIDGGATWAPSSTLTGQILALAVDPANSASAYAVVLTSSTFSMPAGPATNSTWTIYKSGDGGVTWQTSAAFTLSPVTAAVSRIVVNPLNSSIVYAFVNSALMRSADAGASWQQLNIPAAQANLGETNPTAFAIAPSQPNIAYATTYYFPLVKSFDGGVTWQPAAPIGAAGENALAVDPQNPSVVWLVDGVGIHKSTDGGATFQTAAAMGDGSWRSIAVSNVDSSQVFASDLHNVYATFDGGLTWTTVASGQINAVFALASQIYVAASVSPTVFLTKLDPTLTQIVYSTFIGPGSISHIAVDPAGNVYMAGTTESHLFPTTPGALGSGFASSSAGFVTKVRADGGALLYSTLLDGMPVNGIAIDAAGNAVIAGAATGAIPVTPNALQSTAPGPCTRNSNEIGLTVQVSTHAFAAKLNAGASAYLYATWLTGSCGDVATDVAIDSTGAAWVGGTTYSPDFATTANAMTGSFPTASDAGFVSQLSAAGDRLLYSTFVGSGSDTTVNALALDQQGNVVIAGAAPAQATSGSYQRPASSCPPVLGFFSTFSLADDDGFVMKLSPGSSAPLFLATIGGACQDYISRLAIDSAGDIWVSGLTFSSDFTTVAPFPNLGSASSSAGFLAALDPTGSALLSASISSNAGAVAAGPGGTVYYTEPLPVPSKTGSAVLIASIDATLPPAIALDQIHSFGPSQPLSPAYVPFNVAPGEAVRLIGRGIGPVNQADASAAPAHVLPGIAGVQVTFNGIVAQLVSVQANQIVCFVPFALDGATSANVQVTYAGAASNLYSIGVVPQNVDLVAVANQDGSLNSESNPAPVNSVAAIYLTGLGQTNPPSVDGALNTTPFVSPRTIPQIAVNGSPEQPVFLGAAVGQVAGVMQVNLFVPDAGASQSDAVYIGAAFLRIWTTPHP